MKIVLVGAGNLATNIGKAFLEAGHDILQVYSRTMASASSLASLVGGSPATDVRDLRNDADAYLVSVKDSVIAELAPCLCTGRENSVFIHTAGSVPLGVFEGMARHYGVLYPMQTFSKSRPVDFLNIPCFVEANDDTAFETINDLAYSVSGKVYVLPSEGRKRLHLAAVFACNFVNHCYEVSSEILQKSNLPFDVMLPLIDETADKVHAMSPKAAQTGPAVRYDKNIIRSQSEMLKDNPILKQIYDCMSLSIHHVADKEQ